MEISAISPSYLPYTPRFFGPSGGASRAEDGGCATCPKKADETRPGGKTLSEEEKREVEQLKQRDKEVRAHEQAHVAAGGSLVRGGTHYEFESGPDGKRYAVGGEVSIDTTPVRGNPRATIAKMQRVRQAALAPAQPSSQDRSVAASATQKETEARQELAQKKESGEVSVPGSPEAGPKEALSRYTPDGKSVSRSVDSYIATFDSAA